MSIAQTGFTSNGTFTVPANCISKYISVYAWGAYGWQPGVGRTNVGFVTGQMLATLGPFNVVCGQPPPAPNDGVAGGAGFSGGGGGGGWKYGSPNTIGFYAGGGGGSTAVLDLSGHLYLEAGGGDGGYNPNNLPYGGTGASSNPVPTDIPAGTGGGYASNTPANGTNVGYGAGSGGAAGGNGGAGASGVGGAGNGGAGATNGNNNAAGTSGAGVGSGGLAVPNAGASFADTSNVINVSYGGAVPPGGNVVFQYHVADAPSVPILKAPAQNGHFDSNAGITFQGTYQAPSGDTGALAAVSLQMTGGPTWSGQTRYWNGVDFSSTTPVWLVPSTGAGAINNEDFTVVIPASILTDGVTYTWTLATEESLFGLQSSYAGIFSFVAVIPPTVTLTSPTGTITTDTPTVSWTNTTPAGAQISYRYLVYLSPQVMPAPGGTVPAGAVYDSGVVSSAATSFTLPSGHLHSVSNYYGYMQITETGAIPSLWDAVSFTDRISSANAVTLTATASTDPITGCPAAKLVMTMTGSDALSFAWFQADYGNGWQDIIAGLQNISGGTCTVYDLGAPFNTQVKYQVAAAGTISGDQKITAWSATVTLAAPGLVSTYWWVVPPTAQGLAMQLSRVGGGAASTSATSGQTITSPPTPGSGHSLSLAVEQWEQQGIFRGFGRTSAVVVHGDLWDSEFDLSLYFSTPAIYAAFDTIRDLQEVVLMKSDMEGSIYWVTLGSDFNPGILRETGRHNAPKRTVVVHCTPSLHYAPANPFIPTN